jgi:hypothetical protein
LNYWPRVHNGDRGVTCPRGQRFLPDFWTAAGPLLLTLLSAQKTIESKLYRLTPAYGITAVAWFENVLSTLSESTAVTT